MICVVQMRKLTRNLYNIIYFSKTNNSTRFAEQLNMTSNFGDTNMYSSGIKSKLEIDMLTYI